MKRPNSDNEIRYREYPLSVEDIKNGKMVYSNKGGKAINNIKINV